jgi:oxygen-independent coproporphyrinogen III oxidase
MYVHPLYHWPPKSLWAELPRRPNRWNLLAAYVHYPFCRKICEFCGYETRVANKHQMRAFPLSILTHIDEYESHDDFSRTRLEACYFGGGTASLLSANDLYVIIDRLNSLTPVNECEITLECEPGTISKEKLRAVHAFGVNRISVAAQSMADDILDAIGRMHNTADSLRLIENSLDSGINNVHIDLMYGLPGQSLKSWETTVQQVARLPVTHVSTYKLFVFQHGLLHRLGRAPRAEDETEHQTHVLRTMNDVAQAILESEGFKQYTLTEYARPGFGCRYVQRCFDGSDVLPLGPSAFGRCGSRLLENTSNVHEYLDRTPNLKDRSYQMSAGDAFKRDVILGLWLLRVSLHDLAHRHNITIGDDVINVLKEIANEDQIKFNGEEIEIASHQRFHLGQVMRRLADLNVVNWEDPRHRGAHSSRLKSILRVARRDPVLFRDLHSGDLEKLKKFWADLSEQEANDLESVIKNVSPLPEHLKPIRVVWEEILRERAF